MKTVIELTNTYICVLCIYIYILYNILILIYIYYININESYIIHHITMLEHIALPCIAVLPALA